MMTCKCGCTHIIYVGGKTSDLAYATYKIDGSIVNEHDGYVPFGLGIGGGDYIDFSFCVSCGQIQDFIALPQDNINERFAEA